MPNIVTPLLYALFIGAVVFVIGYPIYLTHNERKARRRSATVAGDD